MRTTPRVSVICPTHNRSTAITATIESVRAQTIPDWELIVVSDGSTDDTDAVVAAAARDDRRIRPLRIEHRGHPSPARNAGAAIARGAVIAYIDHDDRWCPTHLALTLDQIAAGADVVATGGRYVDQAGATVFATRPHNAVWHPEMQLMGPMFEPSRFVHRTELLARCGGWRTGPGVEDWDLLVRLADLGARFATVAAHTVAMETSTTARRGRIRLAHHIPVATFGRARDARLALDRLRAPRARERLQVAFIADVTSWFARLREDPALVLPADLDPAAALADLDRTRHDPVDPDLLTVVADRGRFSVAQPVACLTADHARRVENLADRIRPAQRDVIDDLLVDRSAAPHTSHTGAGCTPQPVR